tara:strand:+ start:386 stop:772 length:387 start_codon:yes stop_codon:yes gene_type:complete
MQKEVRSQRLTALLQTVANPMLAPFVKIPNLVRELAIAQDIDPDFLVNDVNDAQIFAEILRGMNAQQGDMQDPTASGEQPASVGIPDQLSAGPAGQGSPSPNTGNPGGGGTPPAGPTPTDTAPIIPEG